MNNKFPVINQYYCNNPKSGRYNYEWWKLIFGAKIRQIYVLFVWTSSYAACGRMRTCSIDPPPYPTNLIWQGRLLLFDKHRGVWTSIHTSTNPWKTIPPTFVASLLICTSFKRQAKIYIYIYIKCSICYQLFCQDQM